MSMNPYRRHNNMASSAAADKAFRPSLACDCSWEDFDRIISSGYQLLASPKLDGIRAIVLDGKLVSRTLKPIRNQFIQSTLGRPELEGLDGELIVGAPYGEGVFNRTTSGVMSEFGSPDFRYHVFEDAYLGVNSPNSTLIERLEALTLRPIFLQTSTPVKYLEQKLVENITHLMQIEEEYIQQGYEGAILRWVLSPYKQGRSTLREKYMLKLKRFADSEATILGFEELLHNENEATKDPRGYTARSSHQANKRPGGTLGKLLVRDLYKPEWEFNIGGGFDFALRDQIWESQDSYLGKVVKYKYLPVGTLDRPRHPIFLGFRDLSDT